MMVMSLVFSNVVASIMQMRVKVNWMLVSRLNLILVKRFSFLSSRDLTAIGGICYFYETSGFLTVRFKPSISMSACS